MMKSLILLILTLMAGWEVNGYSDVCWNFTCDYPTINHKVKVNVTQKNFRGEMRKMGGKSSSSESCEACESCESCEARNVEKDVKDLCRPTITLTAYKATNTTVSCSGKKTDFFCKYNQKQECEDILSKGSKANGSFALIDRKMFKVSISNVSSQHAGVYWCGHLSKNRCYRALFRQIQLKVEDSPMPTRTSTPLTVPSTTRHPESDSSSAQRGSWLTLTAVAFVCVALLVFLIVMFLCFKRHRHLQNEKNENPTSKDGGHEAKSGSGTGLKTIYVTAGMPASPPATEYYSTINLNYNGGQASDASTLQNTNQTPEYSTINTPSRPGEDSFYSKLTHPQQH